MTTLPMLSERMSLWRERVRASALPWRGCRPATPAVSGRASSGEAAVVAAVLLLPVLAAAALADATLAADAAHAPRALVTFGFFVTGFGTSGYMFAVSAVVALAALVARRMGHRTWHGGSLLLVAERAIYVFVTIAVSGVLAQAIKHVVGRARPQLLTVDGAFHFEGLSVGAKLASFPSGHTTSAFAAAVALGYMLPARRGWLFGGAVLIGLSRILVGAHYPSDVVAGAALGSLVSVSLARSFAMRHLAFSLRGGRPVIEPLRLDRVASAGQQHAAPGRYEPEQDRVGVLMRSRFAAEDPL